jgi:putative ABC transport system substrate-binding protein
MRLKTFFQHSNIPSARMFWLFCAMLFALCSSVEAQESKLPRIGYVSGRDPSNPGPDVEAFRQGLRDLGYVEGKTLLVEYRYAEGKLDQVPALLTELVQLKPDVLVVQPLTGIQAAKGATKTIPIVMVTTQDPVATGIIDSLARPGGNITGVTTLSRELSGKRLELLKELIPRMSRVGVLSGNPESLGNAPIKREYEAASRTLKIPIQFLDVRGPNPDLEGAFAAGLNGRVNAILTIRGPLLNRYTKQIVDLAVKNRLPSMFEGREFVEAGGLTSYAAICRELQARRDIRRQDSKRRKASGSSRRAADEIRAGHQFENCQADWIHNSPECFS